ncbi:hypothetical protein CEUSTIGMA_g10674.t1 [Chlamydomonas eustigma]|uniref:Uncharacterized protein n=1 Tax=Chlamydomonas eustigma TaxID=1157962 RepID=A0A250XJK3_9CHLO|nr:hypothetical protein CEUSTIGMA_g10674.t1 [Chlamydomonas eustigma]|eukprot:GAX83248.1 hypothetical protein CEUSTIGMA_g10674.t1 [Chlamydomonas eustigma]
MTELYIRVISFIRCGFLGFAITQICYSVGILSVEFNVQGDTKAVIFALSKLVLSSLHLRGISPLAILLSPWLLPCTLACGCLRAGVEASWMKYAWHCMAAFFLSLFLKKIMLAGQSSQSLRSWSTLRSPTAAVSGCIQHFKEWLSSISRIHEKGKTLDAEIASFTSLWRLMHRALASGSSFTHHDANESPLAGPQMSGSYIQKPKPQGVLGTMLPEPGSRTTCSEALSAAVRFIISTILTLEAVNALYSGLLKPQAYDAIDAALMGVVANVSMSMFLVVNASLIMVQGPVYSVRTPQLNTGFIMILGVSQGALFLLVGSPQICLIRRFFEIHVLITTSCTTSSQQQLQGAIIGLVFMLLMTLGQRLTLTSFAQALSSYLATAALARLATGLAELLYIRSMQCLGILQHSSFVSNTQQAVHYVNVRPFSPSLSAACSESYHSVGHAHLNSDATHSALHGSSTLPPTHSALYGSSTLPPKRQQAVLPLTSSGLSLRSLSNSERILMWDTAASSAAQQSSNPVIADHDLGPSAPVLPTAWQAQAQGAGSYGLNIMSAVMMHRAESAEAASLGGVTEWTLRSALMSLEVHQQATEHPGAHLELSSDLEATGLDSGGERPSFNSRFRGSMEGRALRTLNEDAVDTWDLDTPLLSSMQSSFLSLSRQNSSAAFGSGATKNTQIRQMSHEKSNSTLSTTRHPATSHTLPPNLMRNPSGERRSNMAAAASSSALRVPAKDMQPSIQQQRHHHRRSPPTKHSSFGPSSSHSLSNYCRSIPLQKKTEALSRLHSGGCTASEHQLKMEVDLVVIGAATHRQANAVAATAVVGIEGKTVRRVLSQVNVMKHVSFNMDGDTAQPLSRPVDWKPPLCVGGDTSCSTDHRQPGMAGVKVNSLHLEDSGSLRGQRGQHDIKSLQADDKILGLSMMANNEGTEQLASKIRSASETADDDDVVNKAVGFLHTQGSVIAPRPQGYSWLQQQLELFRQSWEGPDTEQLMGMQQQQQWRRQSVDQELMGGVVLSAALDPPTASSASSSQIDSTGRTTQGGLQPAPQPSNTLQGGLLPAPQPSNTLQGGLLPAPQPSNTLQGGLLLASQPSNNTLQGGLLLASQPSNTLQGGLLPAPQPLHSNRFSASSESSNSSNHAVRSLSPSRSGISRRLSQEHGAALDDLNLHLHLPVSSSSSSRQSSPSKTAATEDASFSSTIRISLRRRLPSKQASDIVVDVQGGSEVHAFNVRRTASSIPCAGSSSVPGGSSVAKRMPAVISRMGPNGKGRQHRRSRLSGSSLVSTQTLLQSYTEDLPLEDVEMNSETCNPSRPSATQVSTPYAHHSYGQQAHGANLYTPLHQDLATDLEGFNCYYERNGRVSNNEQQMRPAEISMPSSHRSQSRDAAVFSPADSGACNANPSGVTLSTVCLKSDQGVSGDKHVGLLMSALSPTSSDGQEEAEGRAATASPRGEYLSPGPGAIRTTSHASSLHHLAATSRLYSHGSSNLSAHNSLNPRRISEERPEQCHE